MPIKDIFRSMLRDYFIIFTGVIASQVAIRFLLRQDQAIDLKTLVIIFIAVAFYTLPHLLFWSNTDLSKAQWAKRRIIHFIVLEIFIVSSAYLLGWIEKDWLSVSTLMVSVLVVYFLVWGLSWQTDRMESHMINQKLAELKDMDGE